MSTLPGQIGRYTILEKLAVGGMAVVYLAFETGDSGLQRLVVIKQILPQFEDNTTFLKMFQQEARLAANINHPNVVEIHELGSWRSQPFLAMEYVSGVPLNILMRKAKEQGTPFPVGVAIGIISQACSGAHAAHELKDTFGHPAHLVHRDLTPHNLMISEGGHIKILDFGVAKANTNQDKTETGMLKGKLPYMSPEQLWQTDLDRRSDVFTLGVVFWELLSGDKLFARDAEVATINAVLNGILPKIESLRPDVSPALASVAIGALHKEADKRTPTAKAFGVALQAQAREAQLDSSEDAIRGFVEGLLGSSLEARRTQVSAQIERSINASPPGLSEASPPLAQASSLLTSVTSVTTVAGVKRGIVVGGIGATVGAAALLFGLSWFGILSPTQPTVSTSPAPHEGISIMLAPTLSPEILREDLEPLRRYLQRELDKAVDWRFGASYAETAEALLRGDVDFASLPPTLFVLTKEKEPRIELIAGKVHSGTQGSDGVLLVREDGPIQSRSDIRGTRLCYTDPKSTTGYILPRAALRRMGIDPDKETQQPAIISGDHLQLIRDISTGRCDIGGTFIGAFMSADKAGLSDSLPRILEVTGRTPHDAITAGPDTPQSLKVQMRTALLDFDPNREAGQKFLGSVERLTGFVELDLSVYDSIRAAIAAEEKSVASTAP